MTSLDVETHHSGCSWMVERGCHAKVKPKFDAPTEAHARHKENIPVLNSYIMQANMLQAYRDVVWNERWFEKEYILVLFTCICHYYISSMCCSQIHPCVFADRSMSQSTAKNV